MRGKCQSVEILKRFQTEKYKYLALPMFIVFISLVLKFAGADIRISQTSAISGFLLYLFLLRLLRVSRIGDEHSDNIIYSPIYGSVSEISSRKDFTEIKIKKNIFMPVDVRSTSAGDVFKKDKKEIINKTTGVSWKSASGKIKILDPATQNSVGVLFGIIPFKAEIKIKIPAKYEITIKENDKVESGETEIGRINES
ncbi:MAG: hypothetical protein CSB55_02995 [Candidatus Cloacimonadota bacterium]|nr:MAG: hypothetical protein CSB55_02995 [Candidatus Cloacimonadota bacterium]